MNDNEGNWVETVGCVVSTLAVVFALAFAGLIIWGLVELIQLIQRIG